MLMSNQYEIIALDLDGTLTNNKKEITPVVKDAIYRLRDAGKKVILASGRPTEGIYYLADELEMDKYGGYILSFNGGKIIDYKTKEVLYTQTVPERLVPAIREFLEDTHCVVNTYKNGAIYTTDPNDEYVKKEAFITKMPVIAPIDFWSEIDFGVNKFLLTAEPDYAKDITYEMANRFYGSLNIFRSEPFFIEVCPPGIDKARSLDKLLEKIGYTKEQLVACGDGYNDITMIAYAGMGVAMANGCDDVKAKAKYICPSNEEDGIADVIDKFFLAD